MSRTRMPGLPLTILVLAAPWCAPAQAAGDARLSVTVRQWTVPWPGTRPRDPAVAADGQVWFVGQDGDYLARFDPDEQTFRRYDLPAGTGPHNVVVGPAQRLWVAGNRSARILRLQPDEGTWQFYRLPDGEGDPHTQQFGPEGNLWFTMQWASAIGRLDVNRGAFRIIQIPTEDARPYGLDIAPDGDVWFTEFGLNKLARLDPETVKVGEYPLLRPEGRPRRLALAADGSVWYADFARGYLGRLHPGPDSGRFEEWRVPGGEDARPYALALDGQGRPWFVETGPRPNNLVAFDPKTEAFVLRAAIPGNPGAVRNMVFDPETDSFWFGTDGNTLGQAVIGAGH